MFQAQYPVFIDSSDTEDETALIFVCSAVFGGKFVGEVEGGRWRGRGGGGGGGAGGGANFE